MNKCIVRIRIECGVSYVAAKARCLPLPSSDYLHINYTANCAISPLVTFNIDNQGGVTKSKVGLNVCWVQLALLGDPHPFPFVTLAPNRL